MALTDLYTAKQIEVLKRSKSSDWFMLINHGAKRSGKTVVNNDLFIMELRRVRKIADRLGIDEPMYILAGVSSKTIQNNVLTELYNKYGITFKFDKHGSFVFMGVKIVQAFTGTIAGLGGIRGMTAFGAYINEGSLAKKEVFAEIISRCSGEGARVLVDTNPDNPEHWLLKDYILNPSDNILSFKYRLDDNTFLSKRYIDNIKESTPSGVFYQRDIEGDWVSGEGVIYKAFAAEPDKYMLKFDNDSDKHSWMSNIDFITIGIDFGGNRSLTTFVATAIGRGFKTADPVMDYHIKGEKGDIDPERLYKEFIGFYYALQKEYPGIDILYAFADNEAQYLINGLRRACFNAGLSVKVMDSAKRRIVDRIYCGSAMIAAGKMRIAPCCELLKSGLRSAVWDSKAAEKGEDKRLDNFSSDIDILDAWEYSWERFMSKLMPGFTGEE